MGVKIPHRVYTKGRRKLLYAESHKHLGEVFRTLAQQKECRIEEGHLMPDHVHMMMSIPPKYAVSQVVGYIKGKSAIHMARVFNREKWAGPNVTFELVSFDGKGSSQESLLQLKSATDQGVRYIVQNLSSSVGLALIDASAEMALRWTATGFLEAEKSFRKGARLQADEDLDQRDSTQRSGAQKGRIIPVTTGLNLQLATGHRR